MSAPHYDKAAEARADAADRLRDQREDDRMTAEWERASAPKHTPGPWGILGSEPRKLNFDEDTRFWVLVDGDGYSPALVPPWDRVEPVAPEEAFANARLIAAAPELFEYVESSAQNGCATAIALIAKARGAA